MLAPEEAGGRDLFQEVERQLNVCNSCRYCEGYCPVWPGLELRTNLTKADMLHLGNLCHDCRDCYSACMYTAPHEFDLNPPKIFSQIRLATYRDFVWRPKLGNLNRPTRLALVGLAAVACILALAFGSGNGAELASHRSPSPYGLIPHLVLVVAMAVPVVYGLAVLAAAAARYWSATHGAWRDLGDARAWAATLGQAGALAHMHGGGQECDYAHDQPGPSRRRVHHLVSYGFGSCLVSTISAAIIEQFTARMPPYPFLSVPVVTGTLGGVMIATGCVALLVLKRRANPVQGTEEMRTADVAMLVDLAALALTGLATLVLRQTAAFGIVLTVHLAAVLATFCLFPYTKFVHFIFRILAIYKHNLETGALRPGRSGRGA